MAFSITSRTRALFEKRWTVYLEKKKRFKVNLFFPLSKRFQKGKEESTKSPRAVERTKLTRRRWTSTWNWAPDLMTFRESSGPPPYLLFWKKSFNNSVVRINKIKNPNQAIRSFHCFS